MSSMICIKLFGDINYSSEELKILKFLDAQGYKFDFLSCGGEE